MNFKEEMEQKIKQIDQALEECLPKEDCYPSTIFEAMRYSVFAGGKRLRPMMLLASCQMLGGNVPDAMPYACAMEMIHTYSLIHDDLPAMDNDDYRRGRLTSHKVFGENIAILAGDALLNEAFEIMASDAAKKNTPGSVKAMHYIAMAAGTKGMIAGQVVDVLSEGKQIEKDTLDFIHAKKTAAMIQGALMAGGAIAGASQKDIALLEQAGYKIGVAFQIQDDILDVISTQEVLGKPIHSDEKNQKTTYVTLLGLEQSKRIVKELSQEAVSIFQEYQEKGHFLASLVEYLIDRTY